MTDTGTTHADTAAQALRTLLHTPSTNWDHQDIYRLVHDLSVIAQRSSQATEHIERQLIGLDNDGRVSHDETRTRADLTAALKNLQRSNRLLVSAGQTLAAAHNEISHYYDPTPLDDDD